MTTLVTGATGNVGRQVVRQLLEAGERVRALTRKPEAANLPDGVEVYEGDLTRPATLPAALEGVERLFLFPVGAAAREVVALACAAGVRRMVVLSSAGVDDAAELTETDDYFNERTVERAVEASGVEWTHMRPGEFMANTLDWAESIRAEGVVRAPWGEVQSVMIHEVDIAAVAVAALLEEGHAGATYVLTGPERITPVEQARALGRAIGREVRFEELTPA